MIWNCLKNIYNCIPGFIFWVLYSKLYVLSFICHNLYPKSYTPSLYSSLFLPGFVFQVVYSKAYIPSFIFQAWYSNIYILGFICQGLYSRIIFQVSYSRFCSPGFLFQVLDGTALLHTLSVRNEVSHWRHGGGKAEGKWIYLYRDRGGLLKSTWQSKGL